MYVLSVNGLMTGGQHADGISVLLLRLLLPQQPTELVLLVKKIIADIFP